MPDLIFASRGAAEAIRQQEKLNETAGKLEAIYRDDSREAEKLRRAANSIYESTKTNQEKLLARIAKIKTAQAEGLIPPEKAATTIEALQTKMGALENKSNSVFGEGALTRFASFAAGLAPVATAITAITNEFRSQLELIDRAAETQLALVPSRQNLIDNLVGRTPEEIARTLANSQKIALGRGVPEVFINDALGTGVSASGGELEATLAAVDFAAKKFADRPDLIAGAVGSSLDLNAVTGSTDPRVAAGLVNFVAQQSRLTSASQLSKTVPNALTSAAGFGATREGGAALFSTLSNAIKDQTGDVTKTTVVSLGKAIEAFEERATGLGAVLFKSLPTLDAKIIALQESADLRGQFLSKPLAVPGEAIIPVRNLLDSTNEVGKRFRSNRDAIPGNAGLIKLSEEGVANLAIDPLQPLATADRQLAALTEDLRRKATPNLTPEARQNLKEILQRVGRTNLGANSITFLDQLSDGELGISVQEASDTLEREAIRLRSPKAQSNAGAGVGAPGLAPREASEAEMTNAKILQKVSDILERSEKVQIDQKALTQETNRQLAGAGLTAGAD